MDLKQEITFGGKKKVVYPTKRRINLIKEEATKRTTALEVVLFLIFIALLAIAAKFAVVDPLMSADSSRAQVAQAQSQLDDLKATNADYEKITADYSRYVVANLSDEEINLVNRDKLVTLLENKVINVAYVSSIKVVQNSITLTCVGVNLSEVSGLVQSLESDELVSHVTVSTAQSKDGKQSQATIEVALKGATEQASQTNEGDSTKGATNG